MRFKLGIAAFAATLVAASPAYAQTVSADGVASGTVLQPLTLTNVSDLDFGTVVASTAAGWVRIEAAASGARSVDGTGVTEVLSDDGSVGEFSGVGTPSTQVEVSLTHDAVLYNAANDPLTVTAMFLSNGTLAETLTTDAADGSFTAYVGGEFEIAANQPPGVYEGDFEVTAVYP